MRTSFEVAEHDRNAVSFRQAVDLLVNDVGQVVRHVAVGPTRVEFSRAVFGLFAAFRLALGLNRGTKGDAMQPGSERVAHPERSCLAHQHEKGRLEGIARIVIVAQDSQARTPDHRSMPRDQRSERRFRSLTVFERKSLQQLPSGEAGERAGMEKRA
jgi:hypothetical protein